MREWINNFYKEYRDPDRICHVKNGYYYENEDFYKGYEELLGKRNDKFRVSFCPPKEPGIKIVNKYTEEEFWLKSDQFGFSAPSPKLSHPYDIYLLKVEETKNEQMIVKAKENVISWISQTRKTGGSFLWPMEQINGMLNLNPKYNLERGGTKYKRKGSYIEDRIDLTLFELYEIYKSEILKDKVQTNDKTSKTDDILKGNVLYAKCFTPTMKRWLSQFDSFEEYVAFFGFQPFIDKKTGIPYDLLSDTLEPFKEDMKKERQLYSKEMTIERYEELFNRIADMTKKRIEKLFKEIE